MLYMVVEKFKNKDAEPVYRRFREKGRMIPEGLKYVQSWVDTGLTSCFQLMECDDPDLLKAWIKNWDDIVDFDVVPVTSSEAAQAATIPSLNTTKIYQNSKGNVR